MLFSEDTIKYHKEEKITTRPRNIVL